MGLKGVRRGDVVMVDLGERTGSEKEGVRPVVVIQNDIGNKYSDTTIVAPFSSKQFEKFSHQPTHATGIPLKYDSTALLEQIVTIDKSRIIGHLTHLSNEVMKDIDSKIKVSLGL